MHISMSSLNFILVTQMNLTHAPTYKLDDKPCQIRTCFFEPLWRSTRTLLPEVIVEKRLEQWFRAAKQAFCPFQHCAPVASLKIWHFWETCFEVHGTSKRTWMITLHSWFTHYSCTVTENVSWVLMYLWCCDIKWFEAKLQFLKYTVI